MYNLIIGYNNSSINLINSLISQEKVVFLIDNKSPEEIQIKNNNLYYYQVDIYDMKQVLEKSSKSMLLNVFIVTKDDYLNLMIEETLKSLDNVQVVYNSRALEKLSNHGKENFYLEDFFKLMGKGVN
ncbi:MAG: NAD-binding protein [Clostridium sp.]|uniref:NAD-binding protein n=1 Tax=Clostridium sp. TaxID=1506 RepID=UPI0030278ECC